MTRGLRGHRVQHDDHALAKLRTQINILFSGKNFPAIARPNSTLRSTALSIGVHSNTAC
jgi:hypothetical protein